MTWAIVRVGTHHSRVYSLYSAYAGLLEASSNPALAALRLRCPNCGGGPIFKSCLKMRECCPVCGIRLERGEEGYQVGAYMFNIVASELLFALIFLVVLIATWPTPPI